MVDGLGKGIRLCVLRCSYALVFFIFKRIHSNIHFRLYRIPFAAEALATFMQLIIFSFIFESKSRLSIFFNNVASWRLAHSRCVFVSRCFKLFTYNNSTECMLWCLTNFPNNNSQQKAKHRVDIMVLVGTRIWVLI